MRLKVGKSEKIMIFIKMFLSSFLQILMFLDMKLQNKIKFWPKSKRKFKNSSIRTRTGRPKFDYFSSNFSKNLSISMRYTTLPQEGVFMAELIWANDICNAKFDWFSRKETKSTYEKRPFSARETRFPHNYYEQMIFVTQNLIDFQERKQSLHTKNGHFQRAKRVFLIWALP